MLRSQCSLFATLLTVAAFTSLPCMAADQDDTDIQNAIIRYKAAIQVNPKNWQTRQRLGRAYLMSGNMDLAVEQLQAAIKLNQNDSLSYIDLARAYMRKRDL